MLIGRHEGHLACKKAAPTSVLEQMEKRNPVLAIYIGVFHLLLYYVAACVVFQLC